MNTRVAIPKCWIRLIALLVAAQLLFTLIDTIRDFATNRHIYSPELHAVVHGFSVKDSTACGSLSGGDQFLPTHSEHADFLPYEWCLYLHFYAEQWVSSGNAARLENHYGTTARVNHFPCDWVAEPLERLQVAPKHSPPWA